MKFVLLIAEVKCLNFTVSHIIRIKEKLVLYVKKLNVFIPRCVHFSGL